MSTQRMFLPESLRPTRSEPKRRRSPRFVLRSLVFVFGATALAFCLSSWRVSAVAVGECEALPESYAELEGRWVPALDLSTVRHRVERWPGIAHAEVFLELPGTLHIRAVSDEVCGSIAVPTGWRAVSCSGDPGPRLNAPAPPLLVGFAANRTQLRSGLKIARRFEEGCGATVERVRRITPTDFEIRLGRSDGGSLRHIAVAAARPSRAESWYFEAWRRNAVPTWTDLRLDDRVVIGGAA